MSRVRSSQASFSGCRVSSSGFMHYETPNYRPAGRSRKPNAYRIK